MKKTIATLLLTLGMIAMTKQANAEDSMPQNDASIAREILSSWNQPDQRTRILQQMENTANEELGPLTHIALVGAAAEMATKRNDLLAYQLLIKRLHSTESAEEKVDIIGKLSLWPGADELSASTLPVFIETINPDQKREVNFRLLSGIKQLALKKPEVAMFYKKSINRLKGKFTGDTKALALIDSIESTLSP